MKLRIYKRISNLCLVCILLLLTPLVASAFDYPEEGDFAAGSKAWADNCTRCHNMRSPTDLRDDQWVTTMFHMRVRAGLTGQEARDILTFLQGSNTRMTSRSNAPISTMVSTSAASASGQELYNANCTACHGADGKGAMPGLPDFTAKNGRLSKSDAELYQNIINGFQTRGSVMPMPPRGGNSALSDADISAVLEYIRGTFAP